MSPGGPDKGYGRESAVGRLNGIRKNRDGVMHTAVWAVGDDLAEVGTLCSYLRYCKGNRIKLWTTLGISLIFSQNEPTSKGY